MTWSQVANLKGPTAVSSDAGNTASLGSDNLIYVPEGISREEFEDLKKRVEELEQGKTVKQTIWDDGVTTWDNKTTKWDLED